MKIYKFTNEKYGTIRIKLDDDGNFYLYDVDTVLDNIVFDLYTTALIAEDEIRPVPNCHIFDKLKSDLGKDDKKWNGMK